jgi:hypothetical protein
VDQDVAVEDGLTLELPVALSDQDCAGLPVSLMEDRDRVLEAVDRDPMAVDLLDEEVVRVDVERVVLGRGVA